MRWYKITTLIVFLILVISNYSYAQEDIDYKVGMQIMPKDYSKVKRGLHENMSAIQINDKWGVIDENYVLTVPIIYDYVAPFFNGRCPVIFEKKHGHIDKNGNYIIQPKYDWLGILDKRQFKYFDQNDIIFYEISDKYGLIDINGKEITQPIFSNFDDFIKGVSTVEKNNRWGLIDEFGNYIVPCIYTSCKNYLRDGYNAIAFTDENGMCGFYNKDGKIIVPFSKKQIPHDGEIGSTSPTDEVPPVFKVNGKFELVKNIERFSDIEWFLDENTINNKSFLTNCYNQKKITEKKKEEQRIAENVRPIELNNQNFKNRDNNTVAHCSYKVGGLNIQWKYSDNRKKCKYCSSILSCRKYTSNELNNHKKNASLHVVYDALTKHWSNTKNHDANLQEKELNDYYAWQKTTGLSAVEIMMANQTKSFSALLDMASIFSGGELSSNNFKIISLYEVGDGDFCNRYHEDLYYRNR